MFLSSNTKEIMTKAIRRERALRKWNGLVHDYLIGDLERRQSGILLPKEGSARSKSSLSSFATQQPPPPPPRHPRRQLVVLCQYSHLRGEYKKLRES